MAPTFETYQYATDSGLHAENRYDVHAELTDESITLQDRRESILCAL